jgi:hypothetical protein
MALIGGSLITYGTVGMFNMLRSFIVFQGKDILLKNKFEQTDKTFPKLNITKHNEVHGFELIKIDKKIKLPTYVGSEYVKTPVGDAKMYDEENFLTSRFKCLTQPAIIGEITYKTPQYMYYDNFVILSINQPNFTHYDMKITNMNYNEVKDKLNIKLKGFYNEPEKNNIIEFFPRIDMNMIVKEYKNNGFSPIYFATFNSLKQFGEEKRVYSDNLDDIISYYSKNNRLPFTFTSLVIGFLVINEINVFKILLQTVLSIAH